jgi:spermidine synthase
MPKKVSLLLFFSGACALVYQTVWFREFRHIFGASTAAQAAVLAVFMGGLGVGSVKIGRLADLSRKPLQMYGFLELGVALCAALTPGFLTIAQKAYYATGGSVVLGYGLATLVRLLLATLILFLPTFLMGGTLPSAVRAAETQSDYERRDTAWLYGANTLGAVAGCLLTTFVLLEYLGAYFTLMLAVCCNILVALVALIASKRAPLLDVLPSAKPNTRVPKFIMAAAFIVGFGFFLLELVWYRMLAPILGGSVFTFGLILATALAGVGLGGLAYARYAPKTARLSHFAFTCMAEGLLVLFPLVLGDKLAVFAMLLRSLGATGFGGLVLSWALVTAVVVLPAAFVSGYQFPLLIALLGKGAQDVGKQVGTLYGFNTLGAIGGALAGGFGVISFLGAPATWRLVGVILLLLGFAAALLDRAWKQTLWGVIALSLVFAAGPTAVWRHSPIGAGRANKFTASVNQLRAWQNEVRHSLVWDTDGLESSVALLAGQSFAFAVNGKIDGNARGDAPTQVMLGLVGAALHPDPKTALVIGLGTGSTAGWLADVPSITQVTSVELEPAILRIAQACKDVNRNVLENPKVKHVIGDAREVLYTLPQQYDLIVSEPSNPYRAGIASLLTQEFYKEAQKKLHSDGLFLQWVQAYEVDAQTIRTVMATLASVFPNVETWQTHTHDVLFVAGQKANTYDLTRLGLRLAQEPFKTAQNVAWGTEGVEGFLAHFVARGEFASHIAQQEMSVNTDDSTLLEYHYARTVGRLGLFSIDELREAATQSGHGQPAVVGDVNWQRVADFAAAGQTYLNTPPHLQAPDKAQQQRLRAEAAYLKGNYPEVLQAWQSQTKAPEGRVELMVLGHSLAETGSAQALTLIEALRSYQSVEADMLLTRAQMQMGQTAQAKRTYLTALAAYQKDPWPMPELMERALGWGESLAKNDASFAHELLQLLQGSYAAGNLKRHREKIASTLVGVEPACVAFYEAFEPNVVWNATFLKRRYDCYASQRAPLFAKAAVDIDSYWRAASPSFGMLLGLAEQPKVEVGE